MLLFICVRHDIKMYKTLKINFILEENLEIKPSVNNVNNAKIIQKWGQTSKSMCNHYPAATLQIVSVFPGGIPLFISVFSCILSKP